MGAWKGRDRSCPFFKLNNYYGNHLNKEHIDSALTCLQAAYFKMQLLHTQKKGIFLTIDCFWTAQDWRFSNFSNYHLESEFV